MKLFMVGTALLVVALSICLRADTPFDITMRNHYLALATVPTSATAVYSTSVWLKSIELIPQSNTSPTCTVTDGNGVKAYDTIALSPNHSYRDERSDSSPLYMAGGIIWSCSDNTVKGQLITKY